MLGAAGTNQTPYCSAKDSCDLQMFPVHCPRRHTEMKEN